MRNVGTHVNNFREIYSCCDFLVQPRGVFEPGRKHCSVWLHLNLNEAATDMKTEFCCTWTWVALWSVHLFKWKEATRLVALLFEGGNNRYWKQSFVALELELGCTWTWRRQQNLVALWSFQFFKWKEATNRLVALWSFHLFKWKEATTGSFCIVSCFVLSWWELHLLHLKLSIAHKINDNLLAFTWLSHLILDIDPRCSACVNLLRQKSKEMVEPSAIAGRSSEMSQKGSMVVETPLHTWQLLKSMSIFVETPFLTWHTTSDWSFPVKIVSTMQEQEEGTMPVL